MDSQKSESIKILAIIFLIIIAGSLAYSFPAISQAFIYNRELVLSDQIWRLLTGHFVHFSLSHLLLNMAGIIIVLLLLMKGGIKTKNIIGLYLFSGTAISVVLLFLASDMAFYGGLSALIMSYATYFCLHSMQAKFMPVWLSLGFLSLLIVKLILELHGAGSIALLDAQANIKVATIAHIAGVISAAIYWALIRIKQHIEEILDIF